MFGIFSRKKSILESGLLDGFTDHHSHLLPGVDDGFQTADLTLEALRTMEQAGVADVWLTPHIMEDVPNTVGALKQRFEEFSATYNGSVRLHLAAENMMDGIFAERWRQRDILMLGDSHPLIETSYFRAPIEMRGLIGEMLNAGLHPILAHPERYKYMDCPKPYPELCTEHVVVMDYVEGISVSHPDELLAAGYDLKEIGTKLVDNYATQVLDEGFFHADPHPGNIMVRGGQIVLLDLGMTGRLNAKTRSVLKDMIFAVAEQDSPKLADGLLRFAGAEADPEDYPALLADLDVIVKEFGTVDLAELDIAAMLTALTQMAQRHGIEVPSTVTTVGRALVTLEGLLDEFIPDVNMIQIISDHIASSTSKKDFAKDETKSLALESHQALHSLLAAANEMKVASRMLTRGQLRVNMEMVGSQEPIHLLANMVNRLTMALIVVGLFIGSSIVYYAGIKPVIFGIPIVGFLGYVIAFILSVWIVFDIYFKGRDSKKR